MLIRTNACVPFARPLVYATFRDRLVELVPYLPSVKSIQLKSRQEKDDIIEIVNEWQGKSNIPQLVRPWLSEDLLKWTEYNIWNGSDFSLDWKISTHVFTDAVHCSGKNNFRIQGGATLIESEGKLEIEPKLLRGIPLMMRGSVASIVEQILSRQIEPNLLLLSQGVSEYLNTKLFPENHGIS